MTQCFFLISIILLIKMFLSFALMVFTKQSLYIHLFCNFFCDLNATIETFIYVLLKIRDGPFNSFKQHLRTHSKIIISYSPYLQKIFFGSPRCLGSRRSLLLPRPRAVPDSAVLRFLPPLRSASACSRIIAEADIRGCENLGFIRLPPLNFSTYHIECLDTSQKC